MRNIHIYKGASIEIEMDVTNKKADYGDVYVADDYTCYLTNVNLDLYIIEFPISFKYRLDITSKVAIAPYLGVGISKFIYFGNQAKKLKLSKILKVT